jgi:transcriptional regulator with XRE-family HTH domain
MAWQDVVGEQIRQAREVVGMSQEALGKAVGKSRNMINQYEAGSAKLTPETLGKIAVRLGMTQVNVNGYRFFIEHREEQPTSEPSEQFKLEFDKEHVFPGAIIKISPTRLTITITATAPLRPAA